MTEALFYSMLAVLVVSAISLVGVLSFLFEDQKLKKIVFVLIGLSVGSLFGNAFLHLIPESFEGGLPALSVGLLISLGVLLFFIFEKFFHWYHHHEESPIERREHHPLGFMVLFADAMHNFMDGIIIAASFLISPMVGLATAIAVIFHEIPQEIGDFGLLLHAGFSKTKALLFNFFSAAAAFLGVLAVFTFENSLGAISSFLVPIAAGGFIYIAGSDLVPELHKHRSFKISALQLFAVLLGFSLMWALVFFE